MSKLLALLLLGLGLSACQHQPAAPLATDQVNPLVGNAGYVAATGYAPTTGTADDARVQAHLAYAERVLRQQPAGPNAALARRRTHLLDVLHRYWTAGVFPRNYDHPDERRPCFIDRAGRLCAVGYLVAETAGRPLAEAINQQHQYDLIADMHTPALAEWVAQSGLTKAECALIQPTYGPATPVLTPEPVTTGYAVGSATWGGLNVMLLAINAGQLREGRPDRGPLYAGLLGGAGQLVFGACHLPKDEPGSGPYSGWNPPAGKSYAAERTVSYLNIGAGTATLALSTWNLLRHRPAQVPRTAIGVVGYPGAGTGLALTRRF